MSLVVIRAANIQHSLLVILMMACTLAFAAPPSAVGAFADVHTVLSDFLTGAMAKAMCLMLVTIGLFQGIVKQSFIAFMFPLSAAMAISMAPTLLESLLINERTSASPVEVATVELKEQPVTPTRETSNAINTFSYDELDAMFLENASQTRATDTFGNDGMEALFLANRQQHANTNDMFNVTASNQSLVTEDDIREEGGILGRLSGIVNVIAALFMFSLLVLYVCSAPVKREHTQEF